MTDTTALAASLQPLIERVRTDITAVKKANGEQAWTDQPLTPDRLARHLNGGPARGVCPIGPGESVTMVGLLDFDSHGGEVGWVEMSAVVRRVVETMEFADGAAPILFRSSGGRGVHLYVLWDEPQDARSVRVWLKGVLAACGLRSGTKGVIAGAVEVYPKQDSVAEDGNGSQFILPLAGRSVALEWCDLAGCYVESSVIAWPFSPAVPVVPPEPPRVRREVLSGGDSAGAVWRSALDALTNKGERELEYDDWRNVVFAIHHETDGSDDGLELALDWSARSGKHNETFLIERVWPYVRSDRGGAVITGRTIMSLASRLHGWSEPLSDDSFGVVEDDDHGFEIHGGDRSVGDAHVGAGPDRGGGGARGDGDRGAGALAGVPGDEAPGSGGSGAVQAGATGDGDTGVEGAAGRSGAAPDVDGGRPDAVGQSAGRSGRSAIPDAEHLTTDQANAGRLVRLHGKRLLVAESRWHTWDGYRWLADDADVYRAACQLSRAVKDEAVEWDRRVALLKSEAVARMEAVMSGNVSGVAGRAAVDVMVSGEGGARAVGGAKAVVGDALDPAKLDEMKQGAELAESLHKWSAKSEMKVTIEAAVGLARKMLTVDTMLMDANPWLLNTPGGVVDLQTGGLRKARAADLLTKITAVPYVPGADQSVWLKFVREVCGGDLELAAFVQRWFGYCATGSVREQVFVVHWGQGSNGKSTLLDTIARVLGDYAGVAAPGLLASSERNASERHPTEIAGLRGKRMVTAHESDDGAVLREGFVKQVTGDDKMSGRFMREDFFDFMPTHKVQLLTNHKPQIRGNDPAIWRRVLLVPYGQSWGTAEQVAAGERMHVADLELAERLRGDGRALAGVMAWIVDGAVAWARGGLQAPAAVRAAVAGYRSEQDRLGQFVRECCEIAPAPVLERLASMEQAGQSWWSDAEIVAWSEPLASGGLHGLYGIYAAWCRESGVHALARNRFSDALGRVNQRFLVRDVNVGVGEGRRRVMRVFGLKLLQD